MNKLFDPASPLGSAFNDIFGSSDNVKLQDPPPASAAKKLPVAARIAAARPINNLDTVR